jgi:hypothetical protein
MKIINFIKNFGWAALADRGIENKEYPNGFHVLNYSQIDSRKDDEVACECRGLILDNDLNIICRPFTRFFNYGEMDTKNFDFSNCTVWEKADGSMVKIYFNNVDSRWEIGTRGSAFAEVNHVFGLRTNWTFREAILDAMNFTEDQFQECMNSNEFHKSCTYVAEYISPFNHIVTQYDKPQIVLLSVISNISGLESLSDGIFKWVTVFESKGMNVRSPKLYHASSAEQIVKMAESLENLQEGFVVFDNNTGTRIKVKSSVYVAVHHLRGNGTPSRDRLMEVVLKNEQDELLDYFPEFSDFIEPIEIALSQLLHEATRVYELNEYHENQKDFALAVKDTNVGSICFKARKEKTTAYMAFETMELNQQMKLLEKYLVDCV